MREKGYETNLWRLYAVDKDVWKDERHQVSKEVCDWVHRF